MRLKRLFGVFILVGIFAVSATAQKNYKLDADIAYSGYKYYQAIDLYKKAYTKEKSKEVKAEILFKIAECYRQKEDGAQAAVWYNKAITAKYPDAMAILHVANILKSQGKYEEAIVQYNKYKAANPSDKSADLGIESCEKSKEWKDNPTRHVVNPMPLLNTEEYDFSPIFADKKNEEIYFTSTRQGSNGENISDVTGMNFSDLYQSKRDRKTGKWSEPVVLNATVNSDASEGAACLNRKRNTIYFTRCGVENKGVMGCSIFWAKKAGQKWGDAEIIAVANDTFTVGHPAISADDMTLVFASNMPGGQGGKDLWYITYDKKAKTWSEPTNLGSDINTAGDEMFPFIRDNGELYFSSTGHAGMGGLDIFKAASKGVNQWNNVENLQHPLNSEANDFGIVFEPGNERGFLTTSREGGKGGDDIWEFYMPPLIFSLEGTVKDVETDELLANAKVKLVGTDGSSAEALTDENGFFSFVENGAARYINPNTSYSLLVEKEKYLNAKGKETTVGLEKSKKFIHEYALQPVGGGPIKLPMILYEYDKADLLPESKDSLNYLYNIMVDNPNIVVQLRSHTDFRGSSSYNQRLSQRRAQSCVDYLVKEKGIDPDRIVAKGMGENEPIKTANGEVLNEKYINSLKTKEEKEAAHQKNRRTDFKVLRDDFVPKGTEETSSN